MSPIAKLITDRCSELGISYGELVQQCGYKNQSKGLRRVRQLLEGDTSRTKALIDLLPTALNVEARIIESALRDTQNELHQHLEASERRRFRPHAIIICERQAPEPIWVAGVIGIDRILRIDFAEGTVPISYLKQALDEIRDRLQRWSSQALPAFGLPQSFIVNYGFDSAVEFDLAGKPLCTFDKAIELGTSTLTLSGRPIMPRELQIMIEP